MNQELVEEQIINEPNSEASYLEVEDAFNRFHALAKKLARQQASTSGKTDYSQLGDLNQLAAVGLLEAIRRHGVDVAPLQVQSFIKDQFRKYIEAEIKAFPWRRTTCPECGSSAVRECEHKKQARKSDTKPQYLFGMTEHSQVNVDWTVKDNDGGETTYAELIEDKTDSFSVEKEQNLEQQRATLDKVLGNIPRTYREVITLRRDGKTWDEIAETTGHARSTVIAHYHKAIKSLKRAVNEPKPRYARVGQRVPRLCSLYPWYRPGQRIPWSQDPKFSLSIIEGYRSAEGYEIILAERQDHYRYMTVEEVADYDLQRKGQIQ
jgi:RNA polymerase sigma factor (sigma-70 family)